MEFTLEGAVPVRPFCLENRDSYIQCVADLDQNSVKIIPTAEEGTQILIAEKQVKSGEPVKLLLRENGYGYTTVEIKISWLEENLEKVFTLAFLKPAPNKNILYGLENRPQFHYTPPYGYMNDPNGMVYNAGTGEYHFFYQAYPYAQVAGPKHWGHATTKDLVTFTEHNTALYPDNDGAMWSGSGIVDYKNTAGLYNEDTPPEERILLFYYMWKPDKTAAGLAYTPDGGETWVKAYDGRHLNFIGKQPRHIDPKVFWLEDEKTWVMLCACGHLYTSDNLWDWIYNSSDMGYECPDFYEIKVEETSETKYVRSYAGTFYHIGKIERNSEGVLQFIAESEELMYNGDSLDRRNGTTEQYGWFSGKLGVVYATQHYMDAPDNRIISVSWLVERGLDATGTWAGAMTVATEQKLYQQDGGYLLYSYPVEEIKSLRGDVLYTCKNLVVSPDSDNILENIGTKYADIDGSFQLGEGVTEFGFRLRAGVDGGDITIKYDVVSEMLVADYSNSGHDRYNGIRTMRMKLPEDKIVSMRILLDNIIVESFGNEGEASISSVFSREASCEQMEFYTTGGGVDIKNLAIYRMKSIWSKG